MISMREARSIGIRECMDIIGKEFVEKNKAQACAWYSRAGRVIDVGVGVTDDPSMHEKHRLTAQPYKYRATVSVDRKDGAVERKTCVVPGV